ncbi:MAG: winged helix-turn-helix transcriptional regulator [Alphaproteobacteria bacterium]|nr:winged helix-turn-helix transcriptional regulator [Alphaproteobacteria bacterium]
MDTLLQAVGAPRRRMILKLLWDGERTAGEVHRAMTDVTFGAVSQHLGVLTRAGLVRRRAEGRERYYRADRKALGPLAKLLEEMWNGALAELKLRAEMDEARRGPRPKRPLRTAR